MRPCTEEDRLFRDFIEDISVTSEELAAIVRMPELSVPEVKRLRAHPSPGNTPPSWQFSFGAGPRRTRYGPRKCTPTHPASDSRCAALLPDLRPACNWQTTGKQTISGLSEKLKS
jgi:hypothetical protein